MLCYVMLCFVVLCWWSKYYEIPTMIVVVLVCWSQYLCQETTKVKFAQLPELQISLYHAIQIIGISLFSKKGGESLQSPDNLKFSIA